MQVSWAWEGDDEFVSYEADVSRRIEAAFQSGEKSFSLAPLPYEIDFAKMVQRRQDDRSRRRAVEREPGKMFYGLSICLAPNVEQRDQFVTLIGGCDETIVAKNIFKELDYFVVGDDWKHHPVAQYLGAEARALGVPIVSDTALMTAVEQNVEFAQVADSFIVPGDDVANVAAALKRQRDELDKEQEEAEKKAKKSSSLKSFETQAVIKPKGSTNVEEDSFRESTPPLTEPVVSFEAGVQYVGSIDTLYSFVLHVSSLDRVKNEFIGVMTYHSLSLAKTRVRGSINQMTVIFSEEDALVGEEDVALGTIYTVKFHSHDVTSGAGTYKALDGSTGSIFLKYACSAPEDSLLGFYSGSLFRPTPFELQVEKIDNGKAYGKMRVKDDDDSWTNFSVPISHLSSMAMGKATFEELSFGPGPYAQGAFNKQIFHLMKK